MLSLALIDNRVKAQEAAYAGVMFKYEAKEIERIERLVKEGLDPVDIVGDDKGALFGFRRQARNDLINNMNQTKNFGAAQVKKELGRQKT